MTKKSEARLKRDEMAAKISQQNLRSPFEELEEMYATQMAMFKPYIEMTRLLITPGIIGYLADAVKVTSLVRCMSAEVKDLMARTNAIHSRHGEINKPAHMLNEDEHMTAIMMFQEYAMFYGIHQQNILPIMLELDEHLNAALRAKQAAEANVAEAQAAPAETAEAPVTH